MLARRPLSGALGGNDSASDLRQLLSDSIRGGCMRRRDLIAILGGALVVLPDVGQAQQAKRVPRIAILWHAANANEEGPYLAAVRQGLKDLGYVEGSTITVEDRFPNEEPERFRAMAAELASMKPDVLLAAGASASIAAKNATTTVPVVFMVVPDPVGSKLVDSLARPGGNVTGLTKLRGSAKCKASGVSQGGYPGALSRWIADQSKRSDHPPVHRRERSGGGYTPVDRSARRSTVGGRTRARI